MRGEGGGGKGHQQERAADELVGRKKMKKVVLEKTRGQRTRLNIGRRRSGMSGEGM